MAKLFNFRNTASVLKPALIFIVLTLRFSIGEANANNAKKESIFEGSYSHGKQELARKLKTKHNKRQAKRIILFVGDGMSLTTVNTGRIFVGQSLGKQGEEHQLSFEQFPHTGLAKTYNTNQQTPDSAGTMTAIMTGIKTRAGVLSIGPTIERGAAEGCNKNKHIKTLVEIAEENGWATGIVSNTEVTHATPAAAYAHSPDRNWANDTKLTPEAADAGCIDIAKQLVNFKQGNGIEVVLGGGQTHFLPEEKSHRSGSRGDKTNLIEKWQEKYPHGSFVNNQNSLLKLNYKKIHRLFGLFAKSHLAFESDRQALGEPSLSEMTHAALQILDQHKNHLLIVESGRIDHAHHFGNAYRALSEMQEFDKTVAETVARVDSENTLIVVTADHSHTLSFAGYPTRGNPILGYVTGNDRQGNPKKSIELALDGKPYTTLAYANGRGFCQHNGTAIKEYDETLRLIRSNFTVRGYQGCEGTRLTGRHSTPDLDPAAPNYHQEANVPLYVETHAGDDVPVYAQGPWSHLLDGVYEQNYIFHALKYAAGL